MLVLMREPWGTDLLAEPRRIRGKGRAIGHDDPSFGGLSREKGVKEHDDAEAASIVAR